MYVPLAPSPAPPSAEFPGEQHSCSEQTALQLRGENETLREQLDVAGVELFAAQHLVNDLDRENLLLNDKLNTLEPLRIQSENLLKENVRLNNVLRRRGRRRAREEGGEVFEEESDDDDAEALKEEVMKLQEKLEEAEGRNSERVLELEDEKRKLEDENRKLKKRLGGRRTKKAGLASGRGGNSPPLEGRRILLP